MRTQMTETEKALLIMAWATYTREYQRITNIPDMGPLCKNDSYTTARIKFDRERGAGPDAINGGSTRVTQLQPP